MRCVMRFLVHIIYDLGFVKNYFCDSFSISSNTLFLFSSSIDSLEFDLYDILAVKVYSHSCSHDLIFEYIS